MIRYTCYHDDFVVYGVGTQDPTSTTPTTHTATAGVGTISGRVLWDGTGHD